MENVKLFFKKIEENTKEIKKEIRAKLSELKDSKNETNFNITVNKVDTFCSNIERCIKDNKNILLYGDYDVDGIFSTSMLILTIKNYALNMVKEKEISFDAFKDFVNNKIKFIIPCRDDGYGINQKSIEVYLRDMEYIITLDNGTQESVIDCVRNSENNNRIFVIDHHFNGDFRKDNNILNPNYDGNIQVSTGILVHRLIEKINKRKNLELETFPDLATFTFISDVANLNSHRDILEKGLAKINNAEFIAEKQVAKMLKLRDEVMELAKNKEQDKALRKIEEIKKIKDNVLDLENLSITRRKFITKLIQSSGDDNFTTIKNLQFNIIPKLNAANRITNDSSFLVKAIVNNDKPDSYYDDIIYNLNYINNNRKKLTKKITDEAINYINKHNLINNNFIFIQIEKNLNGLCGLVAQKIHDLTNADVIVASFNETKNNINFSGRGLNIYKQLEIMSQNTNEYKKIFNFGGHLAALGGSINKINDFKELIEKTEKENKFLPKIQNKIDLLKQENIVINMPITLEKYEELSIYLSNKTNSIPYDKKFLASVLITSDMIDNKESILSKIPNSDFVSVKLKMDYLEDGKERTEIPMILSSRDAKTLIETCFEYENSLSVPAFLLELNNNYVENEKNIFGGIIIFNEACNINNIINQNNNSLKMKNKV